MCNTTFRYQLRLYAGRDNDLMLLQKEYGLTNILSCALEYCIKGEDIPVLFELTGIPDEIYVKGLRLSMSIPIRYKEYLESLPVPLGDSIRILIRSITKQVHYKMFWIPVVNTDEVLPDTREDVPAPTVKKEKKKSQSSLSLFMESSSAAPKNKESEVIKPAPVEEPAPVDFGDDDLLFAFSDSMHEITGSAW